MKWNAQWLVITAAVGLMPATAFCFSDAAVGKAQEKAKTETAAVPPTGEAKEDNEKASTHVGKVVETINTKEYSYILLEKKDGKRHWFAVPLSTVIVGQEIELTKGMEMGRFTSNSLNRTFESINFSSGIVARDHDKTIKKETHAGIVSETKLGELPIKVEKAKGPNAFTVAEIYEKKNELAGKRIMVKGKVVKVSTGIMGKNWVHLRDGSGDEAKGTHNLIITSKDVPVVGDIVTVTGDFFKDKDFGNGYQYGVIIENASIKK